MRSRPKTTSTARRCPLASQPNVPRATNLRPMALLMILASVSSLGGTAPDDARPTHWAQPVDVKGAPNLHQVSPSLYRSAQPTAEGMRNLKQQGVVTIVNLRSFNSDRDEIGATGLAYEHLYMKAWHPERKEAVRFLQIVTDPQRTPVLVHCQHGADRTGAMIAIYRVAVQDWSKEEAIREMTQGGFGFHMIWGNLPDWIRDLDVDSLRRDAGIERVADGLPAADSTGPPKSTGPTEVE